MSNDHDYIVNYTLIIIIIFDYETDLFVECNYF